MTICEFRIFSARDHSCVGYLFCIPALVVSSVGIDWMGFRVIRIAHPIHQCFDMPCEHVEELALREIVCNISLVEAQRQYMRRWSGVIGRGIGEFGDE